MSKNSAIYKTLDDIKNYLRTKIGLKAESVGDDFIHRAIEQRVQASRSSSLVAYFTTLQTSNAEFQSLTESLAISETWFFRNKVAFNFFRDHVTSQRAKFSPRQPLRILSLPCSTGEEPYSLVITLLELGMSPKNFKIDAIDISNQSIQRAKDAIYSQYSFRQSNLLNYSRYFQVMPEGHKLDSYIVSQVNFTQGNVLDPLFSARKEPYHIIFCRNLLIYFDRKARNQTLRVLNKLLYGKGIIFFGHAESSQIKYRYFKLINQPSVFAYQKVKPVTQPQNIIHTPPSQPIFKSGITQTTEQSIHLSEIHMSSSTQTSPQNQRKRQASLPFYLDKKNAQDDSTKTPITLVTANDPELAHSVEIQLDKKQLNSDQEVVQLPTLDVARQLANTGQLDQALCLCQDYCKQYPTYPDVYLLLGEIHQAQGQDQRAIKALEKAIYLNPSYYDALVQLVLLKESHGELARATNLRHRIQRLSRQESSKD